MIGRLMFQPIVVLAIAAFVGGQGRGTVAAQAQGACGLLTADEIHALAPKVEIHDGVPGTVPAIELSTCRYTWGEGVKAAALVISVNPASRMYVGLPPDSVKQQLAATVVPQTDDAVISDVGEAGVFKAHSSLYVTAIAYLKGRVLQLSLDGFDARANKGPLLSLLKSAASRM